MSDDDSSRDDLPEAVPVPGRRSRFSAVWIIPLVAALVAVGIAVQSYLSKGPTITVVFKSAEGIEAGKTVVKYKEIDVGHVSAVTLSPDYSRIEVTVKVAKHAEGLVVEDTKFWVVKTQVTLSGISGLGTLLSGNYIGIDPGKSKKRAKSFQGLDAAPVVTGGQAGREFELAADDLGSLGVGSPLYFRRLNVGQVVAYKLAENGKTFQVKVFVNAPYDRFVLRDTRFWQSSGIDLSVGANGLTLKTQSLVSVLVGGVAFESPPDAEVQEPAPAGATFALFADRAAAFARTETVVQRYVLHFNESLRGLSLGAPVECLGLPVGEVTRLGLEYDAESFGLRPRVEIAVYPNRLAARISKAAAAAARTWGEKDRRELVQRLVDRGLRAQLRLGSLISGQLYVSLDYVPGAPKAKVDWTQDPVELPVVRGGLEPLEEKLTAVLDKVGKIPFEEISGDVRRLLASVDRTVQDVDRTVGGVNGEVLPEVKKTIESLRGAVGRADKVLGRVDEELVPSVQKTLEELQRTVGSAQRVLANVEVSLLGPDAPAQQELRDALRELARAARGIRLLADYLERNPGSLIRGKTEEKP